MLERNDEGVWGVRTYEQVPDTEECIRTIYPGTDWFPIDNMWPCEIQVEMPRRLLVSKDAARCSPDQVRQVARSSEHIFQAAKAAHVESWLWVMSARDGYEAKGRGRSLELVAGWEAVKYQEMVDAVHAKMVQVPAAREVLLATGDRRIEEGNWWGDEVWGVYPPGPDGVGRNWLGEILMAERARWRS